jgi:hypothetical protein
MNARPQRRAIRRLAELGAIAIMLLGVAPMMGRADALTSISEPRGNPYQVQLDAQGRPMPFTIAVAGFPAGSLVYVEQCDARPTSAANWAPTRDCDIGTSPAAAIVDPSGRARFDAGDRNHSFQPFVGLGPESLFSCLTPGAASAKNGLAEYRSCQIRVSSNNNQSTADQVFMPIVFGSASAPLAAASHAGSSSSKLTTVFVIIAIVVLLGVAGRGLMLGLRRRRMTRAG